MTDKADEWLTSFSAIQRLRQAGAVDPIGTLIRLAEAQQVRSRAARGRFSDLGIEEIFPSEPKMDPLTGEIIEIWPDIPPDFWRWVNANARGTEVHGEAGVFATTVVFDPDIGSYSETEHIKLFGVTFNAADLASFLEGTQKEIGDNRPPKPKQDVKRAPSVKKGKPPSDESILAKADEMHGRGMGCYAIASAMRDEPGFENVSVTAVRELLKGRWPRGRRKITTG
jgi:hypothetical protein